MRIEVVELGERPLVWTKARRFAPAGAKAIGEVLGEQDFADVAVIVLDWDNSTGLLPADSVKPILHIRAAKTFPEFEKRNTLFVDVRLDVDDIFGNDTLTADYISDAVHEMKEKINQQVALRRG